jgi:CheY-like chemotaxis protein
MIIRNRIYHILLIEDNPGDVRLTQEAFKEGKKNVVLETVSDGAAALKFLRKEAPYGDKATPDLILLDLNLPKWNGGEVLQTVKADPVLRTIPVLVLTTSNSSADVQQSYALHANCFLCKPLNFEQFFELIHKIEDFWLDTAILPSMAD